MVRLKQIVTTFFIILSISGLIFSLCIAAEPRDNCPAVYVFPDNVNGRQLGEVFNVTVGINELVNYELYGFDIMLRWDVSSLEYIKHEVKVPVEVYSDGVLHEPFLEVRNEIDEINGTCWIAYASMWPAKAFKGEGIFFTITFKIIKESDSKLVLDHVFLADCNGEAIPINQCSRLESHNVSGSLINNHRKLRADIWLKWWIKVTWNMGKS